MINISIEILTKDVDVWIFFNDVDFNILTF
jgi:hypothetical protein